MLDVLKLREAMFGAMGQVLTPELCAAIEQASIDTTDRSIDARSFAPRAYHSLTFQVESFRDIITDLHDLHVAHFAETEKHLAGFELKPDYEYMAEQERMGRLIQFTARNEDGELCGNLRLYLGTSLHTGNLYATEDTFYLAPEYRKGLAALSFLRYAEEGLVKVLGVKEIRANTKIVNAASKLMEYRGYRHVANQYVKIFTE